MQHCRWIGSITSIGAPVGTQNILVHYPTLHKQIKKIRNRPTSIRRRSDVQTHCCDRTNLLSTMPYSAATSLPRPLTAPLHTQGAAAFTSRPCCLQLARRLRCRSILLIACGCWCNPRPHACPKASRVFAQHLADELGLGGDGVLPLVDGGHVASSLSPMLVGAEVSSGAAAPAPASCVSVGSASVPLLLCCSTAMRIAVLSLA